MLSEMNWHPILSNDLCRRRDCKQCVSSEFLAYRYFLVPLSVYSLMCVLSSMKAHLLPTHRAFAAFGYHRESSDTRFDDERDMGNRPSVYCEVSIFKWRLMTRHHGGPLRVFTKARTELYKQSHPLVIQRRWSSAKVELSEGGAQRRPTPTLNCNTVYKIMKNIEK